MDYQLINKHFIHFASVFFGGLIQKKIYFFHQIIDSTIYVETGGLRLLFSRRLFESKKVKFRPVFSGGFGC